MARFADMKAADLRGFMADVDREKLPTVAQAKQEQQAERGETRKEKEQRAGWRAEAEAPPAPKFSPGQRERLIWPRPGIAAD